MTEKNKNLNFESLNIHYRYYQTSNIVIATTDKRCHTNTYPNLSLIFVRSSVIFCYIFIATIDKRCYTNISPNLSLIFVRSSVIFCYIFIATTDKRCHTNIGSNASTNTVTTATTKGWYKQTFLVFDYLPWS